MAMAHASLDTLQGAAALVARVSLVSTLPAGDWARLLTLAGHLFFNIYYYYRLASGSCAVHCSGPY